MPTVYWLVSGAGGFILAGCGIIIGYRGFQRQYVRPEQERQRRFFDLAFGHDGSDGLPKQNDIFTRLGLLEHVYETVANAALLNGKGDQLVKDVAWIRRNAVTQKDLERHEADPGAHK